MPRMPLQNPKSFEELFPVIFPDLYGPDASHHCVYRDHLFDFMKVDFQSFSTENIAG